LSPERVLLLRLRLIGDVVLTTPAIRALRLHYPRAHLAYLVEPAAAPVVQHNPHLDEVIVAADRRAPGRLWRDVTLARALRRRRFDLAIDFHGGPRSSWLTWASRAPERIGYEVAGRSWVYTTRVARPRVLRPRHSVDNQWDLLAPLGIAPLSPATHPTELTEDPAAARRVERWMADAGLGGHPLVVVHVSAGNRFRRWGPDRFADVIVGLAEADPRRRFLVVAGPDDPAGVEVHRLAADRLSARHVGAVLDVSAWTLLEIHAIVKRAALYIGCDTGPMHVAGTTETPLVALYGPTLPATWAPWRPPGLVTEVAEVDHLPCRPCDQRVCAPGDFRCLTWLEPSQVVGAAERALAAASR
jgi:ADP-heptose:LPS heptosyltransferase